MQKYLQISIHAPVKGATYGADAVAAVEDISIHAPVKGATAHRHGRKTGCRHFNPRTREGCDGMRDHYERNVYDISIHAPVKGATKTPCIPIYNFYNFNPRTREGCDTG